MVTDIKNPVENDLHFIVDYITSAGDSEVEIFTDSVEAHKFYFETPKTTRLYLYSYGSEFTIFGN